MNNSKNSTNRIINPKSLIIRTLLRWKFILLSTIIASMLSGLYAYKKEMGSIQPVSEETGSEVSNDYQIYMKAFDDALSERYKYLSETIVKDMNPYSQPTATAMLIVKNNDQNSILDFDLETDKDSNDIQIRDEKSSILLSALYNYIWYGIDWGQITEKFNLNDDVFIDELVQAYIENDVLIIRTYYSTSENALELLNFVIETVNFKFNELLETLHYKNLELILLDTNISNKVYSGNFTWLTNRINEINSIVDAKNKFINTYNYSKDSLSEEKTTINKKYILKTAIKGSILGFGLSFIIIMLMLITSGKILSVDEVLSNYKLKLISILPPEYNNKIKGVSKKIIQLDKHQNSNLPIDTRLELATTLIDSISPDSQKIVIISDLGEKIEDEIASKLNQFSNQIQYEVLHNVIDNVQDRKKLSKSCEAMILIGIEKSHYTDINDLLNLLENYKVSLVGTIVL